MCQEADDKLRAAGGQKYFETENIIVLSHQRGTEDKVYLNNQMIFAIFQKSKWESRIL